MHCALVQQWIVRTTITLTNHFGFLHLLLGERSEPIRSTVRRALNLLRASFSPIFQYFSAVNATRVSFSPVFQYFVTYVCTYVRTTYATLLSASAANTMSAMDSSALNSSAMDSSAMDSSALN